MFLVLSFIGGLVISMLFILKCRDINEKKLIGISMYFLYSFDKKIYKDSFLYD